MDWIIIKFALCVTVEGSQPTFAQLYIFGIYLSSKFKEIGLVGAVFFKFITELMEIGFFIIKTNAHYLRSVFQPIAVRFFAVDLVSLVGLKYLKKKNYFLIIKKIGLSSPISIYQPV